MSQPQPRKHLAKRWWGPNGLTIRCTCGQWRSTSGTRTEQDDAHRNHRAVMGETPKDRKPSTADQLRARVRELEAGNARLRAQAETAHVRLWLIEQVLQRVDAGQDPTGIAGDIGPYLDGPLHPDHIAVYRAAQEA